MRTKFTSVSILALIILIAVGVWYYFYSSTFVALTYNDAMDYASIARNVARGEGFISSYITPLGLAHKEGLPHPNLWRAPAWPVVIALFIKIFGPIDQAVAFASGFFYIAALPLIFLLARHLFGMEVAVGSSIIYIFSARNLHFSLSGLTEPMALFMLVAVVFIIYMPHFRNSAGDVLLGLILGIFYLSRYNALVFIPVVSLCWFWQRKPAGIKAMLRAGTVFGLTVLPWLWRNQVLMGSLMFSLQKYEPMMFTEAYPGYTLYMMLKKVDVAQFIQTHPQEMWGKIASNWQEFTAQLFDPTFTGVNAFLFGLFLISLVLPLGDKQKWLRPVLVTCFGLQLAALMVIHYIPRLFFMFMPFYIMYGLAAVAYLTEKLVKRQSFTAVVVTALVVVFTISNLPDSQKPNVEETLVRDYTVSLKKVALLTTKQDLILSNDGHILAWYGDRYAAKLPYSTDMLKDIQKVAPVKMIYLSGRMSWNIPEADDSWRKVFWGKPQQLYRFRLLEKFEDGSVIYVPQEQ